MLGLYRLTAIATALATATTTVTPIMTRAFWKESGWISTCAGIGCTGYRSACSVYRVTSPDGAKLTNYCYMDM